MKRSNKKSLHNNDPTYLERINWTFINANTVERKVFAGGAFRGIVFKAASNALRVTTEFVICAKSSLARHVTNHLRNSQAPAISAVSTLFTITSRALLNHEFYL